MKRMMIIVITLCLVVLATVGTGAAAAQQKLPPPFRVVQYDVTYHDEVVGKLSVNTNEWTYVLNAHGLEPDTEYYFYCLGRYPQIAIGTANGDGDLHLMGAWDPEKVNIGGPSPAPRFVLFDMPIMGNMEYSHLDAHSCHPFFLWFTVWGRLYYLSGDEKIGIPGQTLVINLYDKETGSFTREYGLATTDENGRFILQKAFTSTRYDPMVWFRGNSDWSYALTYAPYTLECPVET